MRNQLQALRLTTGLRENKFGVSMASASSLYEQAQGLSHIKIKGIDCHIGSQITELAPFMDAMTRVLALVDELALLGIELEHIDLGGGLGVRYANETPVDIREYAAAILQGMGHRPQTLVFEPGRYLTANAGVLLTRVINIKENEGKYFAITDAGMNDLTGTPEIHAHTQVPCTPALALSVQPHMFLTNMRNARAPASTRSIGFCVIWVCISSSSSSSSSRTSPPTSRRTTHELFHFYLTTTISGAWAVAGGGVADVGFGAVDDEAGPSEVG